MNKPLLDHPGLQHRNQVGKQVIVAQTGGEAVADKEHHHRHHPHAHELHARHIRIAGHLRGIHLRIEEHGHRHEQREQRKMVTDKRNAGSEINEGIVRAQVIGPQERLLTQLDGSREETEHRPQDRELQQHRQAATHRADTRPLV